MDSGASQAQHGVASDGMGMGQRHTRRVEREHCHYNAQSDTPCPHGQSRSQSVALATDSHSCGMETSSRSVVPEHNHKRKNDPAVLFQPGRFCSAPGDILVARTVRDLVVGSGTGFEDRGSVELRDVPGTWQLLAVDRPGPRAGSAEAELASMPTPECPVLAVGLRYAARTAPWR